MPMGAMQTKALETFQSMDLAKIQDSKIQDLILNEEPGSVS